uniref:hypothetical protein n=1 Tax=Bacillus cereus TaxID=1396 RepID=UPI000181CA58|nr:hypothetical protein [Bacillus cereus]
MPLLLYKHGTNSENRYEKVSSSRIIVAKFISGMWTVEHIYQGLISKIQWRIIE